LIDPWDIFSKRRLNYEELMDKFMVEVDTIQAVLDSDYFIKKLNECIAN